MNMKVYIKCSIDGMTKCFYTFMYVADDTVFIENTVVCRMFDTNAPSAFYTLACNVVKAPFHSRVQVWGWCYWCFNFCKYNLHISPYVFNDVRSGDCGGQIVGWMPFESSQSLVSRDVWISALSCIKVYSPSLKLCSVSGNRLSWSTSMYFCESILLLTQFKVLSPENVMPDHHAKFTIARWAY